MNTQHIIEIPKNKNSNNTSKKYKIINCQDNVNNDKDTSKWIKLENIIKETDIIKIFKSYLLNKQKVIIKIGIKDSIIREYNASKILLSILGFINYLCYFKCNNDLKKININTSIYSNNDKTDELQIILMKEYISDIKSYKWNKDNFNILKSLFKQIFLSLYIAYKQYGFIHNDSHYGNFLLKKQKKEYIIYNYNNEEIKINSEGYSVVIMDFKSSLFEKDRNSYNILCSDFISIINNIDSILKISTKNNDLINKYLLKKIDFDIKYLLELVDKLEYIEHKNIISNYEELLKNCYNNI